MLSTNVSYNGPYYKFKLWNSLCGDWLELRQKCKIQIRIKIFIIHFPDILWIMDYRWFSHSVGFQHPPLYQKATTLTQCWTTATEMLLQTTVLFYTPDLILKRGRIIFLSSDKKILVMKIHLKPVGNCFLIWSKQGRQNREQGIWPYR